MMMSVCCAGLLFLLAIVNVLSRADWCSLSDAMFTPECRHQGSPGWLHVGFQRRHDLEFKRAKAYCASTAIRKAIFVTEDPWDADQDTLCPPPPGGHRHTHTPCFLCGLCLFIRLP